MENFLNLYQAATSTDLCSRCKLKYDVPKLLPCGFTICTNCELEVISNGIKQFKCNLCERIHTIEGDLPVNQSLKKFKKVHLSSNYQELVGQLQQLNNEMSCLKKLQFELKGMTANVRNDCENLCFQIDLRAESAIEFVNRKREELIKEVNDFETLKVNEIENILNNEDSLVRLKEEIECFKNELNEYDDERNVDKLIKNAIYLKQRCEDDSAAIKKALKSDLLNFCSFDNESFGVLKKTPYVDSFMQKLNSIGRNRIDYKKMYRNIQDSFVSINESGCIAVVIIYSCVFSSDLQVNPQSDTELTLYDNKVIELKKKRLLEQGLKEIFINEKFLFLIHEKYSFYRRSFVSKLVIYHLKTLNFFLDRIFKKVIKKIFESCNKLFLITDTEPFINVFNANFELIATFGTSERTKPYYVPLADNIFIKNGFIIIQNESVVHVLNEIDGDLHKSFNLVNSNIIGIDNSSRVLVLIKSNNENHLIRVYDFDGKETTGEINIIGINQVSTLYITEAGKIIINDKSKSVIYFN